MTLTEFVKDAIQISQLKKEFELGRIYASNTGIIFQVYNNSKANYCRITSAFVKDEINLDFRQKRDHAHTHTVCSYQNITGSEAHNLFRNFMRDNVAVEPTCCGGCENSGEPCKSRSAKMPSCSEFKRFK